MKASVSQRSIRPSLSTTSENGFLDLSTQGAAGAFFFASPILPSIRAKLNHLSKSSPMDIVFYFHFHDHNNDVTSSHSLAFYVANLDTPSDKLRERISCWAEEMEPKYTEHCGLWKLMCSGTTLIGYSTSYIHGEQGAQVMQAWRTKFLRTNGCVVSDVCDVTNASDAQIVERTQQAYEQKQSQLLRATLNANITTSKSPAAVKKI